MKKEKTTKTLPEEESSARKYYYFQFKQDFFNSQTVSKLIELAEKNDANPNDYIVFWLKLVVEAIDNDATVEREDLEPVDAGFLISHLKFRPFNNYKDNYVFVDHLVESLLDSKLVHRFNDGSLYIPWIESMTMSKLETSEKMLQRRHQHELKKKQIDAFKSNQEVDIDTAFELFFNKTFHGLVYQGYAKEKERELYYPSIKILWMSLKDYYIDCAFDEFILHRLPKLSIEQITDRPNYLSSTIKKLCKDHQHEYEVLTQTRKKIEQAQIIDDARRKEFEALANDVSWMHQ